jgi:hypothetical protein
MVIEIAQEKDTPAVLELFVGFTGRQVNELGLEFNKSVLSENVTRMIGQGMVLVGKHGLGEIIAAVAGSIMPSCTSEELIYNAALFYVHPKSRHRTVAFIDELLKFLSYTPAKHFVISSPAYLGENGNRFYHIKGFRRLETHWIKQIERTT